MCVKYHVRDLQKLMLQLFSSFLSSLKKQETDQLEDFSSVPRFFKQLENCSSFFRFQVEPYFILHALMVVETCCASK